MANELLAGMRAQARVNAFRTSDSSRDSIAINGTRERSKTSRSSCCMERQPIRMGHEVGCAAGILAGMGCVETHLTALQRMYYSVFLARCARPHSRTASISGRTDSP